MQNLEKESPQAVIKMSRMLKDHSSLSMACFREWQNGWRQSFDRRNCRKIPQCDSLLKAILINPSLPEVLSCLIPGRARVCRGSSF